MEGALNEIYEMEKINIRIGNKVWGRTGGYNNDADKMDGVLFGHYIFHLTLFPFFFALFYQ